MSTLAGRLVPRRFLRGVLDTAEVSHPRDTRYTPRPRGLFGAQFVQGSILIVIACALEQFGSLKTELLALLKPPDQVSRSPFHSSNEIGAEHRHNAWQPFLDAVAFIESKQQPTDNGRILQGFVKRPDVK